MFNSKPTTETTTMHPITKCQGHDKIQIPYVTELAKRVLYMHTVLRLWRCITSFLSELTGQKFQSYKCNDKTVVLPNFKAVRQTQAELHSLKVENGICV